MKYRREIDGLRTIAIVPVVLFHAGYTLFSGGYIGVDIFFVISGYLITSVILEEKKSSTFTLINFYERRARRILPALFFLMAVCTPISWLLYMPNEMKDFSRSLISVVTFISNIFFWKTTGYFETAAELKPLLHTWSLAVEEQFYLLFPLLLMAAWPLNRIKLYVFSLIFALSLISAEINVATNPIETFFTFHNRAWELLMGAGAAYFTFKRKETIQSNLIMNIIHIGGLALILVPIFIFDNQTPSPGLLTTIPTIGATLIILFESKNTIAYKILSSQLFVGVGLISYSLYLWHQPIFAYFRQTTNHQSGNFTFALLIILTLGLATASWKYIEQPFRNKEKFNQKDIFKYSFIGIFLFILIGATGSYTKGFQDFYVANRMSSPELFRYKLIKEHTGKDISNQMIDDEICNYWVSEINEITEKRFNNCAKIFNKGIVVLGDSHAMNLYNILSKANHSRFLIGISKPGCRPHNKSSNCHYDSFNKFLERHHKNIAYIIYHQSGSYLIQDKYGQVDSALSFEKNSPYIFHTKNFDEILKYIKYISMYSPVHWWGPFVEARVNFNDYRNLQKNISISEVSIEHFNTLDENLKGKAKEYNYVNYFSMIDALNIDESFLIINSCITYNDADHFSICGENLAAEKLVASGIYKRKYPQ